MKKCSLSPSSFPQTSEEGLPQSPPQRHFRLSGLEMNELERLLIDNTDVNRDSQYIPKGTDFSEQTDEILAEIEWKLNHRPRKSLAYRTPLEYCKQLFEFDF